VLRVRPRRGIERGDQGGLEDVLTTYGRRSTESAGIGEERPTDGACSSISTSGTPASIRRRGWTIGGRLDKGILVAAPTCSSGGTPKQQVEAAASPACGCPGGGARQERRGAAC
jgi:hypothetical protein